ncbi:MAG TPA: HlyD family secretion protein [Candidatus Kapabacteria bacterium]|jgi:membrane fusion protein (multidrug efflux system)|nr:HlyD family secretion protein [Candidatus Kapabacteria bacterium]
MAEPQTQEQIDRPTPVSDGRARAQSSGTPNGRPAAPIQNESNNEPNNEKPNGEKPGKKKGPIRRALPFLFGAILIGGALYGWHIIQYNKVHEATDDAQINADISPIIPRVAGYVTAVTVADNDKVDSNQVLVQLDAQDLTLKVNAAQAALQNAQAAVASAQAAAVAAHANVATADVNRHKTATDLERAKGLLAGHAITQEQYDSAKAAAESAESQYKSVGDQASASESQVAVAQSVIKQRQSDLDNAKLQVSYATIVAPVRGTVSQKSIEIGEYVQPGQPMMAITQNDIWITANFKETQMEDLRPGQRVEFSVDSYPDSTFYGQVQSVSPATGAKFALLPPDNATGNFVKVTQRVPVKILVDRRDYSKSPLRPGMSVDVTVTTGKE